MALEIRGSTLRFSMQHICCTHAPLATVHFVDPFCENVSLLAQYAVHWLAHSWLYSPSLFIVTGLGM